MTLKNTLAPLIAFIAVCAVLALFVVSSHVSADTTELPATVATSSPMAVGPTQQLVFATTTNCAARTISTTASPIMITFSDAFVYQPSGTFGFLQPASTTVTYDASQYGCNGLRVFAFASSTITVEQSH